MTEVPEEELASAAAEEQAEPSPEEFEADAPAAAVSEDTGTVYDATGEPEATPQDLEPDDRDA